MFNEMFNGNTYRKHRINTETEFTPSPFFNTFPGETHIFEQRAKGNFNAISCAIEDGTITDFDKKVIKTLGVFAPGFILCRTIKERLTMQGIIITDTAFTSSVERLHRYQLINFSRIMKNDGNALPNRLISLTQFGFQLAKTLGINQHYNAMALSTAEAYQVKAHGEGAQLLTNIQKHLPIESFNYRPVFHKNTADGEIVRPTFSFHLWDETLYCEVIRKHPGWTEDLSDKLSRYTKVFDDRPTVILCCESENMSAYTDAFLKDKNLNIDILYTHDTASFGPDFRYFLYGFDNGKKQVYEIFGNDENKAV